MFDLVIGDSEYLSFVILDVSTNRLNFLAFVSTISIMENTSQVNEKSGNVTPAFGFLSCRWFFAY